MNNLQSLLKDVNAILTKHAEISKATSGDFNVFKITDTGTDERIMCRMLYELLNPKGSHGQGGAYLELFLKNILGLDKTAKNAKVAREYNADGRFIDLVIELPNLFIPIEVKIWAGDQPKQLLDYYNFAKNKNSGANTKVYYLTVYGTDPSAESKRDLSDEDIVCLSWKDDIKNWLDSCIATPETIRLAPVREVLLQFKQVILKFAGQLEDKVMNEIMKVLSSSSENIRTAKELPEALIRCRRNKIAEFYTAVDKELTAKGFLPYASQKYSTDPKNINERRNGMNWPGVVYKTNFNSPKNDVEIVLALEIDNYLFVGFWIYRDGHCIHNKKITADDEVLSLFDETVQNTPTKSDCIIYWEYIMYDNDKINFWRQNDNYCKLFDENTFNEIVNETVEQTEQMAKKLIGFRG